MPLALESILGGLITPIGAPPNIVVATNRAETAAVTFAMLDFAPDGLPAALAGVLSIALLDWRLLPRVIRESEAATRIVECDDCATKLAVQDWSSLIGKGVRQIGARLQCRNVRLPGLVRNHRPVQSSARKGHLRQDELLAVKAGVPGDIGEMNRDRRLEPSSAEPGETVLPNVGDRVAVEAVASPNKALVSLSSKRVYLGAIR